MIDTFGTEPAYNHEEYATLHGYRTNWGYWNLHGQQYMTMFRTSCFIFPPVRAWHDAMRKPLWAKADCSTFCVPARLWARKQSGELAQNSCARADAYSHRLLPDTQVHTHTHTHTHAFTHTDTRSQLMQPPINSATVGSPRWFLNSECFHPAEPVKNVSFYLGFTWRRRFFYSFPFAIFDPAADLEQSKTLSTLKTLAKMTEGKCWFDFF